MMIVHAVWRGSGLYFSAPKRPQIHQEQEVNSVKGYTELKSKKANKPTEK